MGECQERGRCLKIQKRCWSQVQVTAAVYKTGPVQQMNYNQ